MDKTQVRDRIDKFLWIIDHPLGNGIAPELLGPFKLLKNLDRFGDVDRSIRLPMRGVAQLADARVPGSGIVPAVGTFLRETFRDFIKLNSEARLQTFEHCSQSCRTLFHCRSG